MKLHGKIRNGLMLVFAVSLIFSAMTFAEETVEVIAGSPTTLSSSGEKPQSKLWQYQNTWWLVAPASGSLPEGTWVWQLDDGEWIQSLRISDKTDPLADVKVVDDLAHILLYTNSPEPSVDLVSVEFDDINMEYGIWSSRTTTTQLLLPSSEIATIDVDSTDVMWLATESGTKIKVYCSNHPYTTFNEAIDLPEGDLVKDDDIAVVAALPNNTVGILWSNQDTKLYGFSVHEDGSPCDSGWSTDEKPASQSAINLNNGMADDHLNVAIASDSTLYAAVKTSYDSDNHPEIALLVRRPNELDSGGTWDDLYEVAKQGTRPIVLLNEQEDIIRVFYTDITRDQITGKVKNNIVYRDSRISSINFGPANIALDRSLNNVTSTKQNWIDELVVAASKQFEVRSYLSRTAELEPVFYKMEENGGSDLLDSSSNLLSGQIFGSPSWVSGVENLALGFDGVDDYVSVSDSSTLDLEHSFTLSAWIKPNKYATQDILNKSIAGLVDGYALSLSSATSSAPKKVFVRLNQDSNGNEYRINSTSEYPIDGETWMHVATTFDGDMLRLYINGLQEAVIQGPDSVETNSLPLNIGSLNGSTRFYEGGLDEVKIYQHALSPSAIFKLFSPDQDLIAKYNIDENSGSTLINSVNDSLNGQIFGSPSWVSGVKNLGLDLDGVDDYVSVSDSSSLDLQNGFTLSSFIKPNKYATQDILNKSIAGLVDGYALSLSSATSSAPKKVFVRLNQDSNGNIYRINSTSEYPIDGETWMHVAATFDGDMLRLYINGSLENTIQGPASVATNSLPLNIGSLNGSTRFYEGGIDDIRIYKRPLSAEEISNLSIQ